MTEAPISFGTVPPRGSDAAETTPIFEEIASAWFRDDRPVPYEAPPEPRVDPLPGGVPPLPPARTVPHAATEAPEPTAPAVHAPPPAPTAPTAPAEFATAADDGWRASAAAAEVVGEELTPAGLPKRRPRARLVPGAAGPAPQPAAAAGRPGPPGTAQPAVAARTAEAIRDRLASYQDGVRQGREARLRRMAATTEAATAEAGKAPVFAPGNNGRRDEEGS